MTTGTYTCHYTCMANKTLYIKESDLPLWERAQKELGESISAVFIDCLKQRLAERASRGDNDKMEKITLTFWNSNEEPAVKKSFVGRWLVSGLNADDESGSPVQWDSQTEYSVAQTSKCKIVVYMSDPDDRIEPAMEVYDDFDEMKAAVLDGTYPRYPSNVIAETAAALGKPYEIDLDL